MTHHSIRSLALAAALTLAAGGTSLAQGQGQGTGGGQAQPPQFPDMTFFITSTGGPDGANFGGLEGADNHCQTLAAKAGAGGKTWRAYLSTQAGDGKPAINARDRIGNGPWANPRGVQIAANVEDLHSDNNKIGPETGVAENGRLIPSRLYVVNQHDVLTGSTLEGRAYPPGDDMTCGNWTKGGEGKAQIGHFDRLSGRTGPVATSWNSAHATRGCSHPALKSSGGAGLLYCFAAN